MKVFVTGSTGNIGTALVRELLSAGHTVLGLTRSDAGVEKLKAAGAEPLRGTLEDLEVLKKASAECDAVAHLAFNHDFTNYEGACKTDRAAISAMGSAMAAAGGNKALIITSGTMGLGREKGKVLTEQDGADTKSQLGAARGPSEGVALGFAEQGVRVMVMRLPPVVHGAGSLGFVMFLLQSAKKDGKVVYIGNGDNRWSTVHTLDAVRAFRLALEKGEAGAVFHAVGEEGVPVKELAHAVGKKMGVPVETTTPEEAQAVFGFMSLAIAADSVASSEATKAALGWTPVHPTLLQDIEGDLLQQSA
ncbi:putative oxidoreductase [Coniochaeta ligniaria NRRL 30616]|uniref:Putative oxidoreductase n=1 Tax=Coniochaeta ligniaria NRRL 30616 TaxID=1408157 RepID=A0A1J7ICS2_9PEZI|nr:putative oxidoreductase [Coniochaeta ligniaria NRRL 30616]